MTRSFHAAALTLGLALLAPATSLAEGHMSLQGGVFAPFKGDPGYSIALQMLGSNQTGKSRFGAEFEYREYKSKIAGVLRVDVDQYLLRGMWQYHFQPDALFTPYVGLGFGISLTPLLELVP